MVDGRSHARHDRFAVAEALGGGGRPATVVACPACGALHRDLLSIQAALRHAWTPRRPRDLRLLASDVAVRPFWHRILGAVGSSRDVISRPLAVGLTGLGIVGLLVTTIPLGLEDAAAPAARPEAVGGPASPEGPATDHPFTAETPDADPLLALSAASLAAGGSIIAVRLLASRSRRIR